MKSYSRDLLLLLRTTSFSVEQIEKEMDCLNRVLLQVENSDTFCTAHQLATRFFITEKKKAILKAVTSEQLRPFCFLINKN